MILGLPLTLPYLPTFPPGTARRNQLVDNVNIFYYNNWNGLYC